MFSLSRGEYATAYAELRSCFRLPQYYRLAPLGHNYLLTYFNHTASQAIGTEMHAYTVGFVHAMELR